MFHSARTTMPALDYVSIIRSVYTDRRAMLAGVFASAVAAGMGAVKTGSLPLVLITLAFIAIGIIRYFDMRAFWKADIEADDAAAAEHWENRAVLSGTLLALVYGLWCLVSMAFVVDPFASLSSASISIAVMVGICARNFGLDRLVTFQMLAVIVPLSLGYASHGDIYHVVLATLLFVMLASFRKLAGDIRSLLLSAVHGRVEASRLAAELDIALTTLEHGLCMLDESGRVTVANERATRALAELGVDNLIGREFHSILRALRTGGKVPRTAIDRLEMTISHHLSGKVLLSVEGGTYFEVTVSSRHARSVLLFEDISERVAAEERISFMARHDTLTGLANRTYFGELAAEDLDARRNGSPRTAALMIIDVDDFKHVNDTYGHLAGDELLMQVARRLDAALPPGSVLARLGGDEFIVYRGQVDANAIAGEAQALLKAFEEPFRLDGLTLNVNASVGLVTSDDPDAQFDELMTKADLALYRAKSSGKGRAQVFHAQLDTDYHYRQRLKADLKQAVQSKSLSLAFQPLLDINTRRVVSCEALARWQHPELGQISPAVFIPLAEEMGIICDITEWVLETAARECVGWPGGVGVAVNISARDFRTLDLAATVDRVLGCSGLQPERLEIEVTETAVIEEQHMARNVLAALSERGIGIALDDFGTGYSSLSYLNALPFTKLKIDRSFLDDIAENPRALRLLASVARVGRDLDLTVVAEGVETEEQLTHLLNHTDVQQVQGYLFSRPLPASDAAELIQRMNSAAIRPRRKLAAVVNSI